MSADLDSARLTFWRVALPERSPAIDLPSWRRTLGDRRFAHMRSLLHLGLAVARLALAANGAAAKEYPPKTKPVPPPGIEIAEDDRRELTEGAAQLRAELDVLTAGDTLAPELRAFLPDVEIFWKAVDWALRYDEFFDKKQPAAARELLREGTSRAESLRAGRAPWNAATGPVMRGFRSEIDGSVQPYAVLVPATWHPGDTRLRHFYVWNHGRGDTLSELAFMAGAMKKVGEFNPEDTIVLAPYGRFCNATKFAGETDVFEGMAEVARRYPIDPERTLMTGFSMGGASVWHLGAHYAWRWAAATPGAGFCETPIYAKIFESGQEPPPWWEQVLWRLYSARDVVGNLANTRLIAYSGELDPQKQSADLMEAAAREEGLTLERLIGPKTEHKYEPATKRELARRLEESAAHGRDPDPAKVRLVTYTLAYPRQAWVELQGLQKHWERAEVTAEKTTPGTISATTRNVTALKLYLRRDQPWRVELDGQELTIPAAPGAPLLLRRQGEQWQAVESIGAGAPVLRKVPGLQGPIDDAFMHRFVFVRPTSPPLSPALGQWAEAEYARAVNQWRKVFRGDVQTVDDTAVTPEQIREAHLVLWGDPSSNALLRQLLPRLPLQWSAEQLTFDGETYAGASCVPILIYPNPLNPSRYVVLNSSFTFRQGSDTSNALQTPKLPDWAIVDLRTPPSDTAPGLVINAGFFDEAWQPPR